MKMQALFSTVERERIMQYLLEHPSEEINMNALARSLRVSPGQVHKYVSLLRHFGVVKGARLLDAPFVRALRVVDNLRRISDARVVGLMRRHLPAAKGVGLYGSWSEGSNLEAADVDIWIKLGSEPKDSEVATLRRELEAALGARVDVIAATPSRLAHFRSKSESLYHSLYHSIVLWGESL